MPIGLSDAVFDAESAGHAFLGDLAGRYSAISYRSAAAVLGTRAPEEAEAIRRVLGGFTISEDEIRRPGGNRMSATIRFGELAAAAGFFTEVHIEADLDVRLWSGLGAGAHKIGDLKRPDYIHNHMIDFWRGRVAVDYEWNSKDQTYDRDLYALRSFFEAGVIDVGVIVTRDLPKSYLKGLGRALNKDGTEAASTVAEKLGASTTGMDKLLSRIAAGRSGGCPVLAIGIREGSVTAAAGPAAAGPAAAEEPSGPEDEDAQPGLFD